MASRDRPHLIVAEIAAEAGVSRTPVREALLQLEESALIRFHRNRGFISVVTVSEADLAEISSSD